MAGPRLLVDRRTVFTPSPFGLLSVAEFPDASDLHWQNGITYTARCPVTLGALTYDECIAVTGAGGAPPAPEAKTDNVDYPNTRGATPFTVYAKFDCSPVGIIDEARQVAESALAQAESWQAERAFWTGQIGGQALVFPHLAAGAEILDAQDITLQTAAVTGGGPFDIAEGLGILEAALVDCWGGAGVIHVPQVALPTLDAWGLVKANGGVLKTTNGNLVAVGAGYPGTSPLGQARPSGQSWLYATGPVFAYRGAARVFQPREAIDRGNNTVEMIAEREFVLGWDCCHQAVLVTLGVPT
jgi:hypothetical protein